MNNRTDARPQAPTCHRGFTWCITESDNPYEHADTCWSADVELAPDGSAAWLVYDARRGLRVQLDDLEECPLLTIAQAREHVTTDGRAALDELLATAGIPAEDACPVSWCAETDPAHDVHAGECIDLTHDNDDKGPDEDLEGWWCSLRSGSSGGVALVVEGRPDGPGSARTVRFEVWAGPAVLLLALADDEKARGRLREVLRSVDHEAGS